MQRTYVILQRVPVFHEGLVQVPQLRFGGPLIAHDRPDQLFLEAVTVEPGVELQDQRAKLHLIEPVDEIVEGVAPFGDDENLFAFGGEGSDGVYSGLRLPGARRGVDGEGGACIDEIEHLLLGGIGVQQQQLIRRMPLVNGSKAFRWCRYRGGVACACLLHQSADHTIVR